MDILLFRQISTALSISRSESLLLLACPAVFPLQKRMALEWFTFLPAEILPEEVPSANEVIYLPNCGSIIISTEQPYDFENPEMRKVAAAIEQELHH